MVSMLKFRPFRGLSLDGVEEMNQAAEEVMVKWRDLNDARAAPPPSEDLKLFFGSFKGSKVLDLGCGAAHYAHLFPEAGLFYIGIDHSEGQLKKARVANPSLPFLPMSFRKLRFPEKMFGAVWACCSLYYWPKADMLNVLAEQYRVLSDDGVLCVVLPTMANTSSEGVVDTGGRMPEIYMAFWRLEEFHDQLLLANFSVEQAFYREDDNSMTFLARKK